MEYLQENDTQAFIDNDMRLVMTHNAGFFSCCTIRLQKIIQYWHRYNRLPVVDSSNQWARYKEREVDVTPEFFKQADGIIALPNQITFTTDDREDQFSDYRLIDYPVIRYLVNHYFSLSPKVMLLSEVMVTKYRIDPSNCLALCYRGVDKRLETKLPSYSELIDKIHQVHQGQQIIIQTDERDFLDAAVEAFPGAIYFTESYLVRSVDEAVQNHIPKNERLYYATHFLAIMNILSQCQTIVTNSGNVGLWLCLFRGNADNVHQYLEGEWL